MGATDTGGREVVSALAISEIQVEQGRLVKTFIRDRVKDGRNRFSFSLEPLSQGIYFLKVVNGFEEILSKRIVRM